MSVDGVYQHIGVVDQGLDAVDGAAVRRPVQCGIATSVASVDVCSSREQQFQTLRILTFRRVVKSSSTVAVNGIYLQQPCAGKHRVVKKSK